MGIVLVIIPIMLLVVLIVVVQMVMIAQMVVQVPPTMLIASSVKPENGEPTVEIVIQRPFAQVALQVNTAGTS